MSVHLPAEVFAAGFAEHFCGMRWIHGDVMLKALLADVMHQLLKARDVCDGAVAEGVQRVGGGLTLAEITANDSRGVVGGEPCIGERPGGCATFHRAVS